MRNDLVYQVKFLWLMVLQEIRKSLQHTATQKNMNLVHQIRLAGGACSLGILEDEPIDCCCGFRSCIFIRHTLAKLLHFFSISAKANLVLGSCFPPLPLSAMSPSVHCKLSWPDPIPPTLFSECGRNARSRDQNSLSMNTISCKPLCILNATSFKKISIPSTSPLQ